MKLICSGKTKEFTPEIEEKISARINKLSKFAEQRGEREIHLTHQSERHLHKVEIVMNFYDRSLAGEGADADLLTAVNQSIEKLEKQLVKMRQRWRDTHRDPKTVRSTKEGWEQSGRDNAEIEPPPSTRKPNGNGVLRKPKIFRVNYTENRKPMTLDEAILEMDDLDYFVYRDSGRGCLSVLVRRPDGNLDLVES